MDEREATRQFYLEQMRHWPGLQLQDLLKAAYQSVFGPGHYVQGDALDFLLHELETLPADSKDWGIEPLNGAFYRFHLSHLEASGLSPDTLGRMFACSALREQVDQKKIEGTLEILLELAREGQIPWGEKEVSETIEQWRAAGFPPVHHSETMRELYHPAYRVIHRDCVWMLPLLARIDHLLETKGGGIVAIDGGSASGKTVLAKCLTQLYDCRVFHMDDFFLRPWQRTEERLAEPGGNVDRERFLEEVLRPVSQGEPVTLRRYDCHTQTVQPGVNMHPKALTIVEGVYSMHPALSGYYDLSVFLQIEPELQHRRIEVRNGPEQDKFFNTWIPLERRYFEALDVQKRCTLTMEVDW